MILNVRVAPNNIFQFSPIYFSVIYLNNAFIKKHKMHPTLLYFHCFDFSHILLSPLFSEKIPLYSDKTSLLLDFSLYLTLRLFIQLALIDIQPPVFDNYELPVENIQVVHSFSSSRSRSIFGDFQLLVSTCFSDMSDD